MIQGLTQVCHPIAFNQLQKAQESLGTGTEAQPMMVRWGETQQKKMNGKDLWVRSNLIYTIPHE